MSLTCYSKKLLYFSSFFFSLRMLPLFTVKNICNSYPKTKKEKGGEKIKKKSRQLSLFSLVLSLAAVKLHWGRGFAGLLVVSFSPNFLKNSSWISCYDLLHVELNCLDLFLWGFLTWFAQVLVHSWITQNWPKKNKNPTPPFWAHPHLPLDASPAACHLPSSPQSLLISAIIFGRLALFLRSSLVTLVSNCSAPLFWCYEVASRWLVVLDGGTALFLRRKAATVLDERNFSSQNLGLEMLEANPLKSMDGVIPSFI